MSTGAITANIDVAQAVLYLFWIFFAGLVYYLHREDKREGYPLEGHPGSRVVVQGWPPVPRSKTFKLASGEVRYAPGPNSKLETLTGGQPTSNIRGAPIEPVGNPMLAGVGPGSFSRREDVVDTAIDDGGPRIVPLRAAPGFGVANQDPDPRGMPVYGADLAQGGVVTDLWVDRSEAIFRYLELETTGRRRVLVPMTAVKVGTGRVMVESILGGHFADVPGLRSPDQVTRAEEDRICAYYGAGKLYALPSRQEPLL